MNRLCEVDDCSNILSKYQKKFCSRTCYCAHSRVSYTCLNCGTKKEAKKSGNRKFCSHKCCGLFKRAPVWPSENGINWLIHRKGYVYALWKSHPLADKANYVFRHRHVAWKESGFDPEVLEQLKNGAHVHHKNGNKTDNEIANLDIRIDGNHPTGVSLEDMEETLMAFGYTVQKPSWLK